jgi:hypothetical protein
VQVIPVKVIPVKVIPVKVLTHYEKLEFLKV